MRDRAGRAEILRIIKALTAARSFVLLSSVLSSAPQDRTALGGRVIDSVTHQPVRGAIVTMRVAREDPFSENEVGFLTSADGRFSFTDPPRKRVEITVTKAGWVRPAGHQDARVVDLAPAVSSAGDLELDLWPEARLEGRALDPSGFPASGVDLSIRHDGKAIAIPTPRTDDEGHFSVGGLQPGKYDVDGIDPSGAVSLAVGQVRDDLIVRISAERLRSAPPVTLLHEDPGQVGSASVSGVVVDLAGVPIRGARVTAFASSNGRGIAEVVTPDGRFQLIMWAPNIAELGGDVSLFAEPVLHGRPPGETRIGFEQMPDDVPPTRTFHIELGQQIENMIVRINRGSAITGRVTDSAGDPVTASVRAVQSSHGINGLTQTFVDSTSTDSVGRYRIAGLREGAYQILAQPIDYPTDLRAPDASGVHRGIAFLDTYFPNAQGLSAAFPVFVSPTHSRRASTCASALRR